MKVYNTMKKTKEEFKPIEEGKVRMYACGPTVYDYFHIGNARSFVTFDMMRRYLMFKGYDVTYVQNFTDIDDKMIRRANEQGITVRELADTYIEAYFQDAGSLNVLPADIHPRATDYIEKMVAFVKGLEDKGFTYTVDGDVYFSVEKFKSYGKLSGKNLDDLMGGERLTDSEKSRKRNEKDFVLWKAKKEGEPAWDSPWGEGRPGWHLECSVMSTDLLGKTIDIHAGGVDLTFPHHENEIAQSEALHDQDFANYWLHVNFLNINNEKMSKSLGNFFTVRDIEKEYSGEDIRFFLLSAHYRSPVNFSDAMMQQAKAGLNRLYNGLGHLNHMISLCEDKELTAEENAFVERLDGYKARFIEAMDDDFNTADGISMLFELVRDANVTVNEASSKKAAEAALAMLKSLGGALGFFEEKKNADGPSDEEIQAMVDERQEARKAKNWAKSDELRDKLKAMGILVEDTKNGPVWKRER